VSLGREWLENLPSVPDPATDVVEFRGVAVASPPGRFRVLLANACIDFARADVVRLHALTEDDAANLAADVTVHSGARVLAVEEADALVAADALGTVTFAYRTRERAQPSMESPSFHERERAYLERWGLMDEA
jgi:hypothetical protein